MAIIFLSSINRYIFAMEKLYVFCHVGAEFLNINYLRIIVYISSYCNAYFFT